MALTNGTPASIETSYRNMFKAGFEQSFQQTESKLMPFVETVRQASEFDYYDRIGIADEMTEDTTRYGDNPVSEIEHDRRRCHLRDYELGKYVDEKDLIRVVSDPTNSYVQAMQASCHRKIDDIIEQAMTVAESERAANIGTALHALSEHVDAGTLPKDTPQQFVPDLNAYATAMAGIRIIAAEQFVVCDDVQAAGTFDRLVRLPDGRIVVADIKTGQHEPKYPHSSTIQIAVYAHGHLYDPDKGRLGYLPDLGVSTDAGLLIHLPAGQARCDLYLLDLQVGWQLAQTAVMVRQLFKDKPLAPYTPAS